MCIFDQIPLEIQLNELRKLVTEESSQTELEKLIAVYKTEDIDGLYDLINTSPMMNDYREIMLDNRNKVWIPKIVDAMKTKSVFVAVGAGHLGGESGVISLLKEAGYRVEPVIQTRK